MTSVRQLGGHGRHCVKSCPLRRDSRFPENFLSRLLGGLLLPDLHVFCSQRTHPRPGSDSRGTRRGTGTNCQKGFQVLSDQQVGDRDGAECRGMRSATDDRCASPGDRVCVGGGGGTGPWGQTAPVIPHLNPELTKSRETAEFELRTPDVTRRGGASTFPVPHWIRMGVTVLMCNGLCASGNASRNDVRGLRRTRCAWEPRRPHGPPVPSRS